MNSLKKIMQIACALVLVGMYNNSNAVVLVGKYSTANADEICNCQTCQGGGWMPCPCPSNNGCQYNADKKK